MRFAHLSDLHLGIRLYGVKMIDEQRYILNEIADILKNEKPDGLLLSGDIYDRPVPPEEAVELFDSFLSKVHQLGIDIYITSGNHDSPERLSFGTKLLNSAGVYVAGKYEGMLTKVSKTDEYGEINIYMLPFIKPSYISEYDEEKTGCTYEEAVRKAVSTNIPDTGKRNIIMAHQFLTGSSRMDSDEVLVGYVDMVGADIFDNFDYAAMGHLHKAHSVGRTTVRYCGSPLKYSFSESNNIKTITIVELREKGRVDIREIPLTPKHDVRKVKGIYEELLTGNSEDYLHITLSDEDPVKYAYNNLRQRYPNLLTIEYESSAKARGTLKSSTMTDEKSPIEIFEDFFRRQSGKEMDEEQIKLVKEVIDEVYGGDER
ncbi:MAG: exonuclease SbcCD subunit D [Clostridiales bacterium]|nr:exonuclease SbcCD subunit D [Clostridiales bacterium]MBS5878035.1 exonuclease SbcCD subunit D [Clostridiales bacterium]MDU0939267.1 exonuclease SbcCD subunit D [Clostridiales bacterium]MDU1042301.1 exonuclease SbcCD subunit D [Clostridiales bacterium]MDU3489882.1 exonuclease SbcCD subunit D [Clostridiales bacterium]